MAAAGAAGAEEASGAAVTLRRIKASDTVGLREKVMWPGRPELCSLPEDEVPEAVHLGAFAGEALVGVLSLFLPKEGVKGRAQYRKVAVDQDWQGKGVGSALVRAAVEAAQSAGAAAIYCHARAAKTEFYERLGFARKGEPFEKYGGHQYVEMERDL
ncbi:unnamed protein product [Polarella glacialis]|uniref:N-acetyltransferase domain-containing protein n=1 Tax=Polarella glacialis TaxID=89957 RepID=A0A813GD14_POLGL|nr:unnamed protein product [Polarella glacialis]CAE8688571.1 unnamed protein product [Polarella glacialis]